MAPHGTNTTPQPQDCICKACNRILATTSPDGDLVPAGTLDGACDTCQLFEGLHEQVRATDEAFKELEGRRPEHGGRQKALEETKAAHRALDNFLIRVEASPLRTAATPDTTHLPDSAHQDSQHQSGTQQQGRKRGLTPTTSPRPKRPRLEAEARRVSFDAAVVFRDEADGRPYQVFNRGSDEYVPGRNAPPGEGGYLDTSGYGVAPTKFFGVKKHKKGWVETKEGKEMDKLWHGDVADSDDADREGVEAQEQEENAPKESDDGVEALAAEGVVHHEASGEAVECGPPQRVPTDACQKEEGLRLPKLSTESEVAPVVGPADGQHYCSSPSRPPEHAEHTPVNPSASASQDHDRSTSDRLLVEDGDRSWTYGFGWNKKLSPASRPKGVQWKPGFDEWLPQHTREEYERRGRGG